MNRQRVAVGTVEDGMVKVRFIPCRRHSSAGLTARADGTDLLCAPCRSQVAEEAAKFSRYNGHKPLADEPVPPAATGNVNRMTARKDRIADFEDALKEALAKGLPWPKAVQQAGRDICVQPKTARTYAAELRQRQAAQ